MGKKFFNIYSLRSKIVLWFAVLFVAMFVLLKIMEFYGIPFTSYEGEYTDNQAEEFRQLNLVADLKKERLQRWIEERKDDIVVFAESEVTQNIVTDLRKTMNNIAKTELGENVQEKLKGYENYRRIKDHLDLVKRRYDVYDSIHIVDLLTGNIIVSTENNFGEIEIIDKDLLGSFDEGCKTYVGLKKDPTAEKKHALHIARCIFTGNEEYVDTAAIMHVNSNDFLKPLLHTGDGLGESGEALLVDQDRKILVRLKHPLSDGSVPGVLEYEIKAEPAIRAARGEEGIISTDDYRGVPVLAAFRYIPILPGLGWGMVVKLDKADVFKLLVRKRNYTILVAVIGTILMLVFVGVISGKLTRPVYQLRETAEKVRSGDFTARAKVYSPDELGFLAETFNSMVENVENREKDLNEKVKTRTEQLENANVDLKTEIHRRKELEAGREKLIKQLETKNAELEQFAYTVSHDLKSPLVTVKGFMFMLEEDLRKGDLDRVHHDTERITNAVDRMACLLDEVLQISRVGHSLKALVKMSFEDLVCAAVELVSGQINELGVKIEIMKELPIVKVDRSRMIVVLQNLIDNGTKFMGDQPEPLIEIGVRKDKDEKVFYVRDNGIGIKPRYNDRIFSLFDKLEPGIEGTGVGLAIAKRVIDMHGGRIWVESDGLGNGSTFCFTIGS